MPDFWGFHISKLLFILVTKLIMCSVPNFSGGALGLFDKEDSILSTLSKISPTHRLDIYGKGSEFGGIDISNAVE